MKCSQLCQTRTIRAKARYGECLLEDYFLLLLLVIGEFHLGECLFSSNFAKGKNSLRVFQGSGAVY